MSFRALIPPNQHRHIIGAQVVEGEPPAARNLYPIPHDFGPERFEALFGVRLAPSMRR